MEQDYTHEAIARSQGGPQHNDRLKTVIQNLACIELISPQINLNSPSIVIDGKYCLSGRLKIHMNMILQLQNENKELKERFAMMEQFLGLMSSKGKCYEYNEKTKRFE